MGKIVVIDDEPQLRKLLSRMLELEGYELYTASDCRSGLKMIDQMNPDVVLCDVFLPDGNGVDLVQTLKQQYPLLEIILLTAHGNIADGVQAIKNGAFDYITKGDDNNRIIPLISAATEKALCNQAQEKNRDRHYCFENIIGRSNPIKRVIELGKRVAKTDVPVLLTGETGTGKEVFAHSIHNYSSRSNEAFMAINCSTFSKELLESELFGHKAGAFTGALKDKKGLFEVANNGTIFLDEIGEMPINLQTKLLRVLESGEFIKVGDIKEKKVNVRLIAATNRDLKEEIKAGNFREDLYYRLSVFHIQLPALRERIDDIPLFCDAFVSLYSRQLGIPIQQVMPEFMEGLRHHPWNGNVRELRNTIERSIIVSTDGVLTENDLPMEMWQIEDPQTQQNFTEFELANIECRHIIKVLQYTHGNKTETARLLKIGLTTLYRKIEEYGIAVK